MEPAAVSAVVIEVTHPASMNTSESDQRDDVFNDSRIGETAVTASAQTHEAEKIKMMDISAEKVTKAVMICHAIYTFLPLLPF